MTGSDYERKFARKLDERGYHVIRAPSSGSATQRDLPDIAFGKPGVQPCLVELKTTGENIAYFTESEVAALQRFATAFSGSARLCARFKGDTAYYLHKPANTRRTETKRYAIDRDMEPDKVVE